MLLPTRSVAASYHRRRDYKHRGNNPIKDVIHPHDAGIGMPPRPPCEVRTSAWYDVIIQILDGVPHLTQTRGLLVADRAATPN